jgi:hypothetical protein
MSREFESNKRFGVQGRYRGAAASHSFGNGGRVSSGKVGWVHYHTVQHTTDRFPLQRSTYSSSTCLEY